MTLKARRAFDCSNWSSFDSLINYHLFNFFLRTNGDKAAKLMCDGALESSLTISVNCVLPSLDKLGGFSPSGNIRTKKILLPSEQLLYKRRLLPNQKTETE